MINWIKSRLIPEAGEWHKMASIQLAAAGAAIGGAITANPEVLLALVTFMPVGPLRWLLVGAVAVTLFVVPTLTRLWNQGDCDDDAQDTE